MKSIIRICLALLLAFPVYAGEISNLSTTDGSNTNSSYGFPENQLPSSVNDNLRALEGILARWHKDIDGSLVSGGSANTYTLTTNRTIAALYDGLMLAFEVTAANTSTSSLNVNSIGAVEIKKNHDVALSSGDLEAGQKIIVAYNSDEAVWQILSTTAGTAFSDPTTTIGDIIYRDASNTVARLALGATDYALASSGTGLGYIGMVKQGIHTVWVPAGAMVSRTTNGAASGTAETSSAKVMLKTLDYDATTEEFAQFQVKMPKSWNEGTVTFIPSWSHAATSASYGVAWEFQGLALSDGDAMDTAFGATQVSLDTGGTVNDIFIGPESSAVTIAGTPAAGDYVIFQVGRAPSHASDDFGSDARLHGVSLLLTINAGDDL